LDRPVLRAAGELTQSAGGAWPGSSSERSCPAADEVVAGLVARAAIGGDVLLELVDRVPVHGHRSRRFRVHLQTGLWGGRDVVWQWGGIGRGGW
jgi:hypothetical protein